jgi:DNA-3-methyladenine glycosylase
MTRSKLPRSFYARDALTVARDLLGLHLVRVRKTAAGPVRQVGRIVETEAYMGPEDLAAHSAGGRRTPRTETMFGPPGHAYVYLIYGMHHCLNVVTAAAGVPHAVLIRALEPVKNVEERTQGPGLLCRALEIDRSHDALDLLGDEIFVVRPPESALRPVEIGAGPRIGVEYGGAWAQKPWRLLDLSSPFISRPLPTGPLRASRRRGQR